MMLHLFFELILYFQFVDFVDEEGRYVFGCDTGTRGFEERVVDREVGSELIWELKREGKFLI